MSNAARYHLAYYIPEVAVTITPTGITTTESFGVPSIAGGVTIITPIAISSGETFGMFATLAGTITVSPTGISTAETPGMPTLVGGTPTITPPGIASIETCGTPAVTAGALTVTPNGTPTGEAFGAAVVNPGLVIAGSTGIETAESFGVPVVSIPVPVPPVECSAWATYADLPVEASQMFSPDEWCGFLATATDILWSATGRRWRRTELTETVSLRAAPPRAGEVGWPYHTSWGVCDCYLGTGYGSTGWHPQWRQDWANHTEPAAVRLPRSDVTGIVSVLLDGGAFTDWALDGSWLARTDGRGWPVCGDRTSVTYTFGRSPPSGGRIACVTLAIELARYASPDPDQACTLPRRLTSVTRQGISFAALDDMKFLDTGLTGLYGVDAWIRSINPKGRTQQAICWSPDLPRARRTSKSAALVTPMFIDPSDEHIRDVMAATLTAGPNVTITPDDPRNTINVAASGTSSSQMTAIAIASVDLSGHRLVTERSDGTIEYASNDNVSHVNSSIWLTSGAVAADASTVVITYGTVIEPSWSWLAGRPLYLGVNGVITQVPPTAPLALFIRQVGVATSPTTAVIDTQSSIVLA